MNYTDYFAYTMEEIKQLIAHDWLQTNKKIISIETLPMFGEQYRIRIWWREQ